METKNILIHDTIILNPKSEKNSTAVESFKGDLLIENDKIVEIARKDQESISKDNIDKIINGENKILMPGLINTHTHISMNLFRGLADDMELDDWLNNHIWPTEAGLNGEYCYIGALSAIVEMIKSGTTTFNDMYFYMEDVAKAVEESGIRGCLSYGMIDFADEEKRQKELKENIDLIKNCNNTAEGRIKTFFGPHATSTASKELLEKVRKEADRYKVGIHIHMNETKKEVETIVESEGKTPFEYLDDLGFLKDDVIAAHGVWLSKEEINIIKNRDVKISHNPCSNMKLSSGISPVQEMIDKRITVGIGTDSVASNNNLDMFEEMKFASLLQKVSTMNPKALTSNQAIQMSTINGAKALNLNKEIGSIEVGKKADLILLDKNTINLTPMSDVISSNLVYAANGSNVNTTICNGKILMENRKLTTLNENEIIEKANKAIKELKN
ncbi:amidohydrolase family protein [Methanobrevibacter sp. TMH8]|uniref:amidohydrolase family protein n=1 Tax=Methanobrevibacter sp. TMH8 TaxID=2848611 RepID=UPI001CCF43A8|nr:amidohydrolase family protein [Methanobrevibacter sp. TMH8]MBZ9571121.1 amidohydrolase family protein [Methanobrevibacter sp. TMH8]